MARRCAEQRLTDGIDDGLGQRTPIFDASELICAVQNGTFSAVCLQPPQDLETPSDSRWFMGTVRTRCRSTLTAVRPSNGANDNGMCAEPCKISNDARLTPVWGSPTRSSPVPLYY